jgi:hypothetical protein
MGSESSGVRVIVHPTAQPDTVKSSMMVELVFDPYEIVNILWMYRLLEESGGMLMSKLGPPVHLASLLNNGDWFYQLKHKLEDARDLLEQLGAFIPKPNAEETPGGM